LLALELWGLGDVALAIPFLRAAAETLRVTLVAKPHAAPLLQRLAPAVEHIAFVAPWTAFTGKYRLHRWPWRGLAGLRRALRERGFEVGVSARPDPRDHALLAASGARRRIGFPRVGSRLLLTDPLPYPSAPHRADYWDALAAHLGLALPPTAAARPMRDADRSRSTADPQRSRRIVIHTGAGHRVRIWPRERFEAIAQRLRTAGWEVVILGEETTDLARWMDALASADCFLGSDSGPGHIAALLGVPTFTLFGPQLPERFAPRHPRAAWIEGAPCAYKPCFDACRFAEPNCLLAISVEALWERLQPWLDASA
jgi:ADP-heptose:LPS heptosyltransferase